MNAIEVANHFIEQAEKAGQELTQMKLHKLLYFAHGWHLAMTGKPLFEEPILAGPYGPYMQSVYEGAYGFGSGDLRGYRILPAWRHYPPIGYRPSLLERAKGLLGDLACRCGHHRLKTLAYGYPPYRSEWLTVKGCKRCGMVRRTWDDLYSESRESVFPDEPRCADLMRYRHPAALAYVRP